MPTAQNREYSKENTSVNENRRPTPANGDPDGQSQTLPHTVRQLLPVKLTYWRN
jgi:hypothetical protein